MISVGPRFAPALSVLIVTLGLSTLPLAYPQIPTGGSQSAATVPIPMDAILPGKPVISGQKVMGVTGISNLVFSNYPTLLGAILGSIVAQGSTSCTGTCTLNDPLFGGSYTGNTSTYVCIKVTGTGSPNQFSAGTDAGCTNWGTGISMALPSVTLQYGTKVFFQTTTGHTNGDIWTTWYYANSAIRAQDSAGTTKFEVRNDGTTQFQGGNNVLYRCATAGTLPVGALTINAASCGSTADTGIRVP